MILAGSEIGSDLNGVVIVRHTALNGRTRGPLIVLAARPGDGWLAVKRSARGTLTLRAGRGRTYCFDLAAETLVRAGLGPCPIGVAPDPPPGPGALVRYHPTS